MTAKEARAITNSGSIILSQIFNKIRSNAEAGLSYVEYSFSTGINTKTKQNVEYRLMELGYKMAKTSYSTTFGTHSFTISW